MPTDNINNATIIRVGAKLCGSSAVVDMVKNKTTSIKRSKIITKNEWRLNNRQVANKTIMALSM